MVETTASGPVVMVAEDDRDVRELVRHCLESDGCEVIPVGDGRETLDTLARRSVDLLVLDLMMPRTNGVEVLKTLRERAALDDLPVLVLSARCREADVAFCLELGAVDYVVKPFRLQELLSQVRKLVWGS